MGKFVRNNFFLWIEAKRNPFAEFLGKGILLIKGKVAGGAIPICSLTYYTNTIKRVIVQAAVLVRMPNVTSITSVSSLTSFFSVSLHS